jgi:hypothetical protein
MSNKSKAYEKKQRKGMMSSFLSGPVKISGNSSYGLDVLKTGKLRLTLII